MKPKPAPHSNASTATSSHGPALAWIRRLQRDLTTLDFYAGPATGIETAATKTAIVRFQRAAHLKRDGLWGHKSQAALDRMLHRKPSKPPPALGWIRKLQRDPNQTPLLLRSCHRRRSTRHQAALPNQRQ